MRLLGKDENQPLKVEAVLECPMWKRSETFSDSENTTFHKGNSISLLLPYRTQKASSIG